MSPVANGGWRGPGDSMKPSETPSLPSLSPPTRDGVGPSVVALPAGTWPTLLDFLVERFPAIARDEWQARMARGEVSDAHGTALPPDAPYRAQTKVHYYRSLPDEPRIPFEATVLFQDAHLLVADKPHFLPVTPSGRYLQETLLVRLKRQLGLDTLAPVHRLDRDTAGLVLFTLQPATRGVYQSVFRDRLAHKGYEAVAPFDATVDMPTTRRSRIEDAPHFMQVHEVPGDPNAETVIERLDTHGGWARYALRPRTGLRHQLRVQMAGLGLPIVNDRLYPVLQPDEPLPDFTRPLQLLARTLEFTDPLSGAPRRFESRQRLPALSTFPLTPQETLR
jgi:tRNA pseudouridine32 synthase/23S rRNA pseudouridine746 synthase